MCLKSEQKKAQSQWSRQQTVRCGVGSLRGEDLSPDSIRDRSEVQARGSCDWVCVVPIYTWTPHRVTLLSRDRLCSPFLCFTGVCLPHFPAAFLQVFLTWPMSIFRHTHTPTHAHTHTHLYRLKQMDLFNRPPFFQQKSSLFPANNFSEKQGESQHPQSRSHPDLNFINSSIVFISIKVITLPIRTLASHVTTNIQMIYGIRNRLNRGRKTDAYFFRFLFLFSPTPKMCSPYQKNKG